jgi:hypothetical protein
MSTQTQIIYLEITFNTSNPNPNPPTNNGSNTIYIALKYDGNLPPNTPPDPYITNKITGGYNIGDNCDIIGDNILNGDPTNTNEIVFLPTNIGIYGVFLNGVSNILNDTLTIGVLHLSYSDTTGTGSGQVVVATNVYDVTIKYSFNEPITPCCFSEGTKILCYTQLENSLICILKEEYRLVQHLKIGDLVKSYLHGYRKVSKMLKGSFVNNPKDEGVANCMYRMLRTQDNGLIEDLTLTRNHGVLVEKLSKDEEKKIDKDNLPVIDNLLSIITADCDKFEKVMDTNVYKYYHFSLDGDGDNDRRFGVWANGLLVEVPSNNMMNGALNVKPLDF